MSFFDSSRLPVTQIVSAGDQVPIFVQDQGVYMSSSLSTIADYINSLITTNPDLLRYVADVYSLRQVNKDEVQFVSTEGYWASGDAGGGNYWYDSTDITTVDDGFLTIVANDGARWKLILDRIPNARQAGVRGNGVADDYSYAQNAINAGIPVRFSGVIRTTQSLQLKPGCKIIGDGNWSGFDIERFDIGGTLTVVRPFYDVGTTVFLYDGTPGDNVSVINASVTAVGTMPTEIDPRNPNYRNLENVGITNITIDGKDKAGIGLYMYRAGVNNNFDGITATKTTKHGILIQMCWNGTISRLMAVLNRGCGISIGKDVFSYGSTFVTVDAITFNETFAYFNGCDSNRNALNLWSPSTPDVEYGIGFYTGRATTFINTTSTNNSGVGIYLSPDRFPVKFQTTYVEQNCRSSAAAAEYYGIWIEGYTGAASRHIKFEDVFISTGLPTVDGIRLSGVEPSRRGEDAVEFKNVPFLLSIKADWGNYRLIDVDSALVITGTAPYMLPQVLNNQLNLCVTGTAKVTVSGGAVTAGVYSGVISSVTYDGVGLFGVHFTPNLINTDYTLSLATSDSRYMYVSSIGVSGANLKCRGFNPATPAFDLADPTLIYVVVHGGYAL
ncbi:MAG: hypothetical protein M0P59_14480 [Gallionella sp.]|jgi:hypothetical protein|nr:hypothetical protein [Gallionella sp.]